MRKSIYIFSSIFLLLFVSTITFADVDDNTTQWQNLRDKIGVVQGTQVGLPTGVSEPKGRIGYILSNVFNSTGHIPNIVLKAFSGSVRTNNNILKWRGGNGGGFGQSQLYDDGTTIGLGGAADAPSLQVDVTGAIGASQYCDGNGNNCFSPSTVSTSSGTVGGTGTAGYVTRFSGPSTIADSVMQDNGTNVGIGVAPSSDRLRVNGVARIDGGVSVDGRTAISGTNYSHTARSTANDRYGFFEVRRDDDTRGAFFGYGNGTDTVQLNLDNASYLSIGGGRVILGTEGTASNHLVTKGYVDTAVAGAGSLWSVNGSEIYYNTANVGIGTNDPATTLDVSGDIRSGTVATNCVGNCPASAAPPVSGDWGVSGNLNVTGNITASNFYNQAPLTSTPLKSAVYTANASGRSTSNRMAQLTINVPSGPNRKYRLTGKAMAYGDGSTYLLARIVKSTGSAYDYQYEYSNHTGREGIDLEGYVSLAPGTHTFYLQIYGGGTYNARVHHSTTYTNVRAWPLQG